MSRQGVTDGGAQAPSMQPWVPVGQSESTVQPADAGIQTFTVDGSPVMPDAWQTLPAFAQPMLFTGSQVSRHAGGTSPVPKHLPATVVPK